MINSNFNSLHIRTPEGIAFSLLLASPVSRFFAWIIDFFAIMVLYSVLNLTMAIFRVINGDIAQSITIMLYFIISIGYNIFFEWRWKGKTPGKRILRLQVIDAEGLSLRPTQIVIRNLLRVVDSMPLFYFVGGISTIFSKKYQRLGDIAGHTVVIKIPEIFNPDFQNLQKDKFNSLETYPHLIAKLRQRTNPIAVSAAIQAIIRRDEIEPKHRLILFKKLADYFKTLVSFPDELTTALTDEQYIRDIIELI